MFGQLVSRSFHSVSQAGARATFLLAATQITPAVQQVQVRYRRIKHWNPAFKWHRRQKVIKMDLPNLKETASDLTDDEVKSRLKERGLLPPRPWVERPYYISSTGGIFEAYVPPEGDGKRSSLSKDGVKQKYELLEKKSKSMLAVRKIRQYEEEFDHDEFAAQAQDIYVKVHDLMAQKRVDDLRDVITERAYPEIVHNVDQKTIRWRFVKSLEPARVVHARCTDVISKDNIFGQVTVRFHTQQILAIYDRFGRLMYGSETVAKDVLEYVVFEKHLSNEYGHWRIHDKIIPDWTPPKEPAIKTYRLIEEEPPSNEVAGTVTQNVN